MPLWCLSVPAMLVCQARVESTQKQGSRHQRPWRQLPPTCRSVLPRCSSDSASRRRARSTRSPSNSDSCHGMAVSPGGGKGVAAVWCWWQAAGTPLPPSGLGGGRRTASWPPQASSDCIHPLITACWWLGSAASLKAEAWSVGDPATRRWRGRAGARGSQRETGEGSLFEEKGAGGLRRQRGASAAALRGRLAVHGRPQVAESCRVA